MLKPFKGLVHTITSDNGKEFAKHQEIAKALNTKCRVPDDQMSFRSYPLLVARELIQKVFREHTHEHQAT